MAVAVMPVADMLGDASDLLAIGAAPRQSGSASGGAPTVIRAARRRSMHKHRPPRVAHLLWFQPDLLAVVHEGHPVRLVLRWEQHPVVLERVPLLGRFAILGFLLRLRIPSMHLCIRFLPAGPTSKPQHSRQQSKWRCTRCSLCTGYISAATARGSEQRAAKSTFRPCTLSQPTQFLSRASKLGRGPLHAVAATTRHSSSGPDAVTLADSTFSFAFSAALTLALIFRALRGRALLRPLSTAMIPSSEDSAPLPSALSSSDEDSSSSSLSDVLLRFLLGAGLGLGAALAPGWTAGFFAAGLGMPFVAGRLALPFTAGL